MSGRPYAPPRSDKPPTDEVLRLHAEHIGRLPALCAARGWKVRTFRQWVQDAKAASHTSPPPDLHQSPAGSTPAPRRIYTSPPPDLHQPPTGSTPPPADLPKPVEVPVINHVDEDTIEVLGSKTIRTLPELLEAAGVDQSVWTVVDFTPNKWDGIVSRGSGKDRTNAIVQLWQAKARLVRRPEFWVRPVEPRVTIEREPPPDLEASERVALVIPDAQCGYHFDARRSHLRPLHDRRALDIAVQVAALTRPSMVIILGDMLDLAPWSTKYLASSGLRFTTQPSLEELHWWLRRLRQAAPDAEIIYIEGNHEHRIEKALVSLLPEAETLRPADDTTGAAALSVRRLVALDALDIRYVGPYGAEYWLWDQVRAHHGTKVRPKGGQTVAAILNDATHSEVVGHIHRAELAHRTIHDRLGRRTIWACSPGTTAHIDGRVPGADRPDWQQALALIGRIGPERTAPSLVHIDEGRAMAWGAAVVGVDRSLQIAEELGRPALGPVNE